MSEKTLFIFSGLPGAGKTTIAKRLAQHTNSTYLRIDTIEQGLRDLCSVFVEGEGYRLSYRIAQDNLRIGNNVIADSCNPVQLTRKEWGEVAIKAGAEFVNIEIICSDLDEHRQRIETRMSDIKNLSLPSWQEVINREYHNWEETIRIVIDTSCKTEETSFNELLYYLLDKLPDFI